MSIHPMADMHVGNVCHMGRAHVCMGTLGVPVKVLVGDTGGGA